METTASVVLRRTPLSRKAHVVAALAKVPPAPRREIADHAQADDNCPAYLLPKVVLVEKELDRVELAR